MTINTTKRSDSEIVSALFKVIESRDAEEIRAIVAKECKDHPAVEDLFNTALELYYGKE